MEELLEAYEKRIEFLRTKAKDTFLEHDVRIFCKAQAECLEDVILEINAALENK